MLTTKPPTREPAEEVRQPRHRSWHAGLIGDYATKKGTRSKYQLYALWVSGPWLEASAIHGYREITRNQVTPHLGRVSARTRCTRSTS